MPEILEGQINNQDIPPVDPDSAEVLRAKLKEAEKRESAKIPEYLSTDGITKDASNLFARVRQVNNMDSESGGTTELPEAQKIPALNLLLKSAQDEIAHPTLEPYDEIEDILKKAISGD